MGKALGMEAGPNQIEEMRQAPFGDLGNASFALNAKAPPATFIDGKSLNSDVLTGFIEGTNHKVPVIIGMRTKEAP